MAAAAMALLGLAWLLILIGELLRTLLSLVSTSVWVIFIAEFALRLALALDRSSFLKRNCLMVIFVGRDASKADVPLAGSADVARLGEEVRKLRLQVSRGG